jgi:hypothetical protein
LHAGKWSYGQQMPALSMPPVAGPPLSISPEMVQAGAATGVAAGLLITAVKSELDTTLKLLILGALAAIALLLIREWLRKGKLDDAQARRLENLAKSAEAAPEMFVTELEQVLAQAG